MTNSSKVCKASKRLEYVAPFIQDCIDITSNTSNRLMAKEVFEAYKEYCIKNAVYMYFISVRGLVIALKEQNITVQNGSNKETKGVTCYGIKFKQNIKTPVVHE